MEELGLYADLHSHSYWSFDGFISPYNLLSEAHSSGIKLAAITEHDNIDSWEEIKKTQSQLLDMIIVPGIEITARSKKTIPDLIVGVIGIGFDPTDQGLKSFLSYVAEQDHVFLEGWFKLAEEIGLGEMRNIARYWLEDIFPDFPERHKQYIPEWVLTRLMYESNLVPNTEKAIEVNKQIVKEISHVQVIPEVDKAINLIKSAGGITLLEHPKGLPINTIENLMTLGFDGIEIYHNDVPLVTRQHILTKAGSKGWIISSGGDYHGVRRGWGRESQLLPHPYYIFEKLLEAISQTSYGLPK